MAVSHDSTAFQYFALVLLLVYVVPGLYFAYRGFVNYWQSKSGERTELARTRYEHAKLKQENRHFVRFPTWLAVHLVVLAGALVAVAVLAYNVSQHGTIAQYNPYTILGLEVGADDREIKRAYRKLSLEYHPDKRNGDDEMFIRIAKAYEALTDPEARENYEKYGNPDGRQALEVGIGLPAFLEDTGNFGVVIAVYVLGLVVLVPFLACRWFGREEEGLLEGPSRESFTWFHIRITAGKKLDRLVEVFAGVLEWAQHLTRNDEEDKDNAEAIQKQLGGRVPDKLLEMPPGQQMLIPPQFIFRNHALLWSHLTRTPLSGLKQRDVLQKDLRFMLRNSGVLLRAMVESALFGVSAAQKSQAIDTAKGESATGKAKPRKGKKGKKGKADKEEKRVKKELKDKKMQCPRMLLEIVRLQQCFIQALRPEDHPLLQFPPFYELQAGVRSTPLMLLDEDEKQQAQEKEKEGAEDASKSAGPSRARRLRGAARPAAATGAAASGRGERKFVEPQALARRRGKTSRNDELVHYLRLPQEEREAHLVELKLNDEEKEEVRRLWGVFPDVGVLVRMFVEGAEESEVVREVDEPDDAARSARPLEICERDVVTMEIHMWHRNLMSAQECDDVEAWVQRQKDEAAQSRLAPEPAQDDEEEGEGEEEKDGGQDDDLVAFVAKQQELAKAREENVPPVTDPKAPVPLAHAPFFPGDVEERWMLSVFAPDKNEATERFPTILARHSIGRCTKRVTDKVQFLVPKPDNVGERTTFQLCIQSTCYRGLDRVLEFPVVVRAKPEEHEEDETAEEEEEEGDVALDELIFGGNAQEIRDEDTDEEDEEDEEEGRGGGAEEDEEDEDDEED